MSATLAPPVTLPVDIYVRVSSVGGREGDSFRSPAEQEAEARAELRRMRLPAGEVIDDLDATGTNRQRPGLQLALDRIRAGQSAGLIVYKLDRLTREVAGGEQLLQEIETAGGRFYAPDMPADIKSPSGELQLGFQLVVNRYTSALARQRFDSAKRGAIERGIPVVVRIPVGLKAREDRRLEIDETWAPYMREARRMAAEQAGWAEVARWLNDRNVPTRTDGRCSGPAIDPASGEVVMGRKGRPRVCKGHIGDDGHCDTCGREAGRWQRQTVRQMLRNRLYLGEVSYGSYVNPNAHEALCDLPTFIASNAPRETEARKPRVGATPSLLGPVVVCANCGYAMGLGRNQRGVRSYKCSRSRGNGECPGPVSIKMELLDAAVTAAFLAPLDEAEILQPEADLTELTEKLATAERRLATVTTPESIDALGEQFAPTVARYRSERDAAALALGEARASVAVAARRVDPDEARASWEASSLEDQREALSDYYAAVVVRRHSDGVTAQLWTYNYDTNAPRHRAFPTDAEATALGVELITVSGSVELPGDVLTLA